MVYADSFASSCPPLQPIWVAYIYFPVLGLVFAALFCVSCQDPGLMERVTDEEAGEGGWFWNEQVGSFRPPGALYCGECGVSFVLIRSTACFETNRLSLTIFSLQRS